MGIFQFFKNNSSKKALSHEAEMLIGILDRGVIDMIDLEKGSPVMDFGYNSREKFELVVSSRDWSLYVTGSAEDISSGTVFHEANGAVPEEVLAFQWTNKCLLELARALKDNQAYATTERGFGWRGRIREDFSDYQTILVYRR